MLKFILIVTLMVADLQQTQQAYRDQLQYQTVEQGRLNPRLAAAWGAPALAGRDYLLMAPASGKGVTLRFIHEPDSGNYRPMKTEGWNALEILVQDPDALAQRLRGSAFEIIGEPAYLTEQRNIRAFQALGPHRELIYFTRVIDPSKSPFNLGTASTFVDGVFIMVVGGRNLGAMQAFYRERLQHTVSEPLPYRISVLSRAYDKPLDTLHSLALVTMPQPFLIELDQYPAAAEVRRHPPDTLPPGIAMVSFAVDSLAPLQSALLAVPLSVDDIPYGGARVGVIRGAAGELIEVVESAAAAPVGTPRRP